MNEHHLNLIQAEIDGLNSESDSERVRLLIAGDSELRTAFEELQAVKMAIQSLGELDPPASLKASIMAAIPFKAPAGSPAPSAAAWWSPIVDLVRLPKPASLAYAFALGLIVAFAVATVLQPSSAGGSYDPISGSMISQELAGYEVLAEYDLGESAMEGHVRVVQNEAQVIVEFAWNSSEPVQARVDVEDEWMGVTGTRHVEGQQDFKTTSTRHAVELSGTGPIKEYVVIGRGQHSDDDVKLNFDVRSGSTALLNRSLLVEKNR